MVLFQTEREKVRCLACNHNCLLAEGKRGICGVRENQKGVLRCLVHSKVIAKHVDPIEKKPLYHFLPGTAVYSIGTIGCNFKCGFCFVPSTYIVSNDSTMTLDELFDNFVNYSNSKDHMIGSLSNFMTITHNGTKQNIVKVFKHHYNGEILIIKPYLSPAIECTPMHKLFVYNKGKMVLVEARTLKLGDLLCIPKIGAAEEAGNSFIDLEELIGKESFTVKNSRILNLNGLKELIKLKREGKTSRELGKLFQMHPVYIRKLTGIIAKKGISQELFEREGKLLINDTNVRFTGEQGEGIPRYIPLDDELAELLGYFCAEGHISKISNRPNSFNLVFSFGLHEEHLVLRTKELLEKIFRVTPYTIKRRTTYTVECGKSSIGHFFMKLCGKRSKEKQVPQIISSSHRRVIYSFMKAFLNGDGCVLKNNISFNTVSQKLAMGLYYLILKLGYLPSFYIWNPPPKKSIERRIVNQSTLYYVKITAEKFREHFLGHHCHIKNNNSERAIKFKETPTHWLVPISKINQKDHNGEVYNCEVQGDHSYLANFVAVSNCQNWNISQQKEVAGQDLSPEQVKQEAAAYPSIAYTYNEPTVFLEYAQDIAKLTPEKKHIFVTNGYFSSQALEEMGFVSALNIDLKSFNPNFYKTVCGAELFPVLNNIKKCHELGKWVEVTTLLIPGENNSEEEIRNIAQFIAGIDKEIPWHISAFHPDFKMLSKAPTAFSTLKKAYRIAKEEGLAYVYLGNVLNEQYSSTYCPACQKILIRRKGYMVKVEGLQDGKCASCGYIIKGVWQ